MTPWHARHLRTLRNRALRIRGVIEQYLRDLDYWNRVRRPKGEPPIVDPELQQRRQMLTKLVEDIDTRLQEAAS